MKENSFISTPGENFSDFSLCFRNEDDLDATEFDEIACVQLHRFMSELHIIDIRAAGAAFVVEKEDAIRFLDQTSV